MKNTFPNRMRDKKFEKKRKLKKESGSKSVLLSRVEFDPKPLYPRFVSVNSRQNAKLRGADPTLQIGLILSKKCK